MSKFGVEFVIGVHASADDLEERVDAFYASLAQNFSLASIDLALNSSKGSISVLLGVECPSGMDPESLVIGVASDAVKKAIAESGVSDQSDEGQSIRPSARVLEFA